MKSITYIFFVAAHFLLYGHAISQEFACNLTKTLKPAKGVCAPDGLRPTGNEPLINFISDRASNAVETDSERSGFSWWTCPDQQAQLVSYCCTVAVNLNWKSGHFNWTWRQMFKNSRVRINTGF
ncbi:hypothetical protein DFH28DRAFT_1105704 [Melampsora americana]|nr:hypothetical protein DFH28DRAFT_1105704 [Melampsora americana]